jgi:HK97 family phage portal protein
MGFFKKKNEAVVVSKYQIITDQGEGFYSWNGNLYKSDIVRAAIRPKARAIGKIVGKHIRETIKADGTKDIKINPDVYMRFLLEEPNPYMTGQMLQEKLAVQLELNNNAFAYIKRDENGYPMEIYPINAMSCEAVLNNQGEMFIKFIIKNGKRVNFRYSDLIHLRKDFNSNEIFGDAPGEALTSLMEIVNTSDQGIVKAIKNSNVIKWLLKYYVPLRAEDLKKNTKEFTDTFLNIDSETGGAAAADAKFDAQQVEPKDYVPNAAQTDRTVERIYSFFNTNKKIVQGNYTEDEWISYYEAAVEPDVVQLSGEYTRKLFSRRERGFGNRIYFEASNLSYASVQTKLGFVAMVDRGAMTPNQWRDLFNWAPVAGGDEPIRRLDTAPTTKGSE